MKIVILRWNNITDDIEKELANRGHEVIPRKVVSKSDIKNCDVLVNWNESGASGAEYTKLAKKLKKKTVLLQHGRRGTSRIFPPFNEELVSDLVCVWSQNDKERLMSVGVDESRIRITGTPIFKGLYKAKHEGKNIVFSPEHWDHDVIENQMVAGVLRRGKHKVTTKVLEGEHNIGFYDNPIVSSRGNPDHLKIVADVLSTADVVVAISESTFELMAEILDIPVIIADIWIPKPCAGDDRYLTYRRTYSNACNRVRDLKMLNEAIDYQLEHPYILKEERAQIAIADGGINIKDPVKAICDVIEQT